MKWYTHFLQISFIYLNLNLFLHFGAAEDVEDPIGKGRKVYKGKYPYTSPFPFGLYLHLFFVFVL